MHHPLCHGGGGNIPALYDLAIIKPFNAVWLAYLVAVLLLLAVLRAALGRRSRTTRRWAILVLGVFTLIYLAVYRFQLSQIPGYPFELWNELPFNPCNLMVFLGIAAVASDRRTLQNFCSIAGTLCVMSALAAPLSMFSGVSLFHPMGYGYYGFHGLTLLLCLSFPVLGLARPHLRDLPPVLLFSALLTGAAHLLNLLLRSTVYQQANYFYTFGIPDNPVLGPLRAAIPFDFLFLLPLVAVLALWGLVIVALCCLAERLTGRRRRTSAQIKKINKYFGLSAHDFRRIKR